MGKLVGISISTILILFFAIVLPNSSAKSVKPPREGVLDLLENDLWGNIKLDGASGKLKFNVEGPNFDFDFKGKGLEAQISYALIRSGEPETILPYQFEIIAEGVSDDQGTLHIAGSYNFNIDLISAEFLLVPGYMLDLPANGRGRPGRYLSGRGLIGYNDTETELQSGCQSSGTNFDLLGIPKGQKAINFTLESTEGDEFTLYEFLGNENKPVVFIFGAYTWNPYRQGVPGTEYLFNTYGEKVNFVIVYVIEPHPHGQICPYTGNFWLNYPANFDIDGQPLYQPDHYEWRLAQAKRMKEALLSIEIPVLVDKMDNPVWCTYGPAPNCAYFIDTDGTVIEKQGWYDPDLMEQAINSYFDE